MDRREVMSTLEEHFTKIYHTNYWNGKNSKSGTGSDLETTCIMRPQLLALIDELNIYSMIDAPCGDFFWMKEIIDKMNISEYLGMDIVKELVEANSDTHGDGKKIRFSQANVVEDILPKVDLIFSRDCLVHFSYDTARKILNNFIESGSTYVLMTTFMNDQRQYPDILDGQWRAINFLGAPFNLPQPKAVLFEGCIEDHYRWTDKCLALWKLEELKGVDYLVSK